MSDSTRRMEMERIAWTVDEMKTKHKKNIGQRVHVLAMERE